jgi:predicted DNA-binding transcriptional regulator YafY
MTSPALRLLELLELLQARPVMSGRELAERLGVDVRTVRRYVASLQEVGIPVEGQRGLAGGYRLRPGFKLPPLMLTGDETVAVVLGLLAARRLGLAAEASAVDGALAKLHRVLPTSLRRQVEALEVTLGFTLADTFGAPVPGETVLLLADAIRRRRRISIAYVSFEGVRTSRELSPLGIVFHGGRWYLAAHDHLRADLRTFRVDRMSEVSVAAEPALEPPDDFDAVAYVSRSLASVPWAWEVEVVLEAPPASVARHIPATLAELTELGGRTLLRMQVESLEWMARLLAGLDCPFSVRRPDELRTSLAELAARLLTVALPGKTTG